MTNRAIIMLTVEMVFCCLLKNDNEAKIIAAKENNKAIITMPNGAP